MTPHPAQVRFLEDGHRFVLAAAGAQSGKTIAAAAKFAARLKRDYNARIAKHSRGLLINAWVVTPTYELATMPQRYLRERWPNARWSEKRANVYMQCEPWPGCSVKFRSAEHPDKLVSEPVDALWLNETARMKAEAWRGGLRMRLNATGGWMIADTTPMGRNWVYTDLYLPGLREGDEDYAADQTQPEFAAHRWRTIDNPAVAPEEVERARATLPAGFFLREYEADFAAFHGQCWPGFNEREHVRELNATDYPEVILGQDYGFGPGHPGVLLAIGMNLKRNLWGVLEEVVAEGETDDWWCDHALRCAAKYGAKTVWPDPSRREEKRAVYLKRIRDRREREPASLVPTLNIRESNNTVYSGVVHIASLFGADRIMIDPRCKVLIRQAGTYHWGSKLSGEHKEWEDKPAKVDDDAPDALRYGIFSPSVIAKVGSR